MRVNLQSSFGVTYPFYNGSQFPPHKIFIFLSYHNYDIKRQTYDLRNGLPYFKDAIQSLDVYYLTDISKVRDWEWLSIQIVFNPPLSVCCRLYIRLFICKGCYRSLTLIVRTKKPMYGKKSTQTLIMTNQTAILGHSCFSLSPTTAWLECVCTNYKSSGDNVSVYSMHPSLVVRSVNVTIFYSCVMIIWTDSVVCLGIVLIN